MFRTACWVEWIPETIFAWWRTITLTDGYTCRQFHIGTNDEDGGNPIAERLLEIYDGTDDIPLRHIKFSKAYITEFQETFNILNGGEMTTYVQISPMEMTINKRLDIERRFFWLWNKTPLKPMKMKEVVADPNIHINNAYWLNANWVKCRDFPVG